MISSKMIQKISKVLMAIVLLALPTLAACQSRSEIARFEPVNITVDGKGIYIIRESDLEALGFQFPPQNGMQLQFMGKSIPAWLVDENSVIPERSIVFYAPSPQSRYSATDTYQLVPNKQPMPGLKILSPGISTTRSSVKTQLHLEKNLVYEPQAGIEHPFFWGIISNGNSLLVPFQIQSFDDQKPCALTFFAASRGAAMETELEVKLNSQTIQTVKWSGNKGQQFTLEIPAGNLQAGDNAIKFSVIGDEMVVDFDWADIQYYLESPEQSVLVWTGDGTEQTISGWNGLVFALAENGANGWIAQAGPGGMITVPTEADSVYFAADQASLQKPLSIQKLQELPTDVEGFSGSDYLIFSPKPWLADLEPLAEYYRSQGLKASVIDTQSIYDQFSGGQVDPGGIQKYLQSAINKWQHKPAYALMVGDFVYDPLQLPKDGAYLPAFFIQTAYGGETVSDYPFSLDENGQPTLAIGRWPVNSREDVQFLVKTAIQWNQRQAEEQFTALRMIDSSDEAFMGSAYIFGKLFLGQDWNTHFPISEMKDLDWGKGNLKYNSLIYFGHGSVVQWGTDPTITIEELKKNPIKDINFVLQFTCLTGYFISPGQPSLSEDLLLSGVPAVIGPTSLTLPSDQWMIIEKWADALQDPTLTRVGDLVAQVWKSTLIADPGQLDTLQTFLLFGDPALKIPWVTPK